MLIATRIKHSQKDITYATFKKFHEFYCLTHCLRLLNTTRDVLYGLYASDFLHQILVFEVVLCAGGRTGGSLRWYTYLRRLPLLPFFLSHDFLLLQHMLVDLWKHSYDSTRRNLLVEWALLGMSLYYNPATMPVTQPRSFSNSHLKVWPRYFPN